jgi:hypothetical protein
VHRPTGTTPRDRTTPRANVTLATASITEITEDTEDTGERTSSDLRSNAAPIAEQH